MSGRARLGIDPDEDCVEIPYARRRHRDHVAARVFPATVRAAGEGLPFALCWRLRRP